MIKKPSSSKSSYSTTLNDTKRNNTATPRLRRLKIEENLLLQSLQKLERKNGYEGPESDIMNELDYKNMMKHLKESYINIKNVFEDVKTMTCSQELLAELEIEEIKKKVLELETTLKSFKVYLNRELKLLKTTEQELMKQMEEMTVKEISVKRKRGKIPSANYIHVVPSPVRLLMTSPFKCVEVQEFQEFMKNSPNRYGGWNEYHHSIFVKYWQKYFGNYADTDFNDSFVGNLAYENFVEEALFKLQGINKESLLSHIEWYKKYLFLKYQQQMAIDKWKSNRRSIRKNPEKVIKIKNLEEGSMTTNFQTCNASNIDNVYTDQIASHKSQCLEVKKNCMKQAKPLPRILGQNAIERLLKPTKQWLSRNYEDGQKIQQINFIENLEKLRVPNWRQYLY